MTGRPLLVDADADAELTANGSVVIDLFSADEVDRLRAAYEHLDHRITTDRSFATGFHATIIDDRPDYRAAAFHAAADLCGAPFAARFRSVDLVMVNWLHKEPAAAAVPFHVDWSMVDERVHRSISVWAPLVDTDATSGAIGVVDGSHELVDFIRAAAHPSYLDTDEFGRRLPGRRLVPLRAGQAVVFDHRLVHFSAPHLGTVPRVALSCELVPSEADLLHFEQLGPGRFRRHRVGRDFFVTYASGDDPVGRPGHLAVDHVDGPAYAGPLAPRTEAAEPAPERSTPSSAEGPDAAGDPPAPVVVGRRPRRRRLLPFRRAIHAPGEPRA